MRVRESLDIISGVIIVAHLERIETGLAIPIYSFIDL